MHQRLVRTPITHPAVDPQVFAIQNLVYLHLFHLALAQFRVLLECISEHIILRKPPSGQTSMGYVAAGEGGRVPLFHETRVERKWCVYRGEEGIDAWF